MIYVFMEALRQGVRRLVGNEKGAELVEWAIWVGAVSVAAVAVGIAIKDPLVTAVTNVLNNINTSVGGS